MTLKDRLKVATKKQLQECLDLLEFRQVGKESFSLPYKLKDLGNVKGSFSANVTLSNGCILIGVKEYSDHVSLDNLGFPILVERYEGSLYLRVWNDINKEDVTHHINMDGARNENRMDND